MLNSPSALFVFREGGVLSSGDGSRPLAGVVLVFSVDMIKRV